MKEQKVSKTSVKTKDTATGGGIKDNSQWIRDNSADYKGRWVALLKGKLLDSDVSRISLHKRLETANNLRGVMFVYVNGID